MIIEIVQIYRCSLLSDIGVEEFSLADILHPTEKQTRRILSVLIPYCYFAIQQRQYREVCWMFRSYKKFAKLFLKIVTPCEF